MTDKSGARPNRRQGFSGKPGGFRHGARSRVILCRRRLRRARDAFMDQAGALLRRVFRDCWWLSAIIAAVLFLPPLLVKPLPAWHDPVALAVLTLAFGIAVLGWAIAIMGSLQRWPGFRLGLTIAIPLGMAMLARLSARDILADSFGVSPDAFPMSLDMLTAVMSLWLTFAGVGALLMLLLFGLFTLQMLTGGGGAALRSMAFVLPLSAMIAMPLASSLAIMPDLPGTVRALDGQESYRCAFPSMPSRPLAVTFLSDTQVLAWMPDTAQPVVLPCEMDAAR
ncbi:MULTISPECIES: hypothetical protein [Paracoccus]|uniref:Uncharacterized protein n=1 Tax=Paracoccus versutus TaxID=34007 RepID=A0A3D9XEQ2_PARVE|nr:MULTISPECIES: hypothetical protein [Paracoccus]REF67493.1 hypothetical protein BDD41_4520 [Paracoccus versutus]WGR58553.1 hypothetical protein E3U25_21845 [Paracoccus versutus]